MLLLAISVLSAYLGLNVSIQPTNEFKNLVDLKYKKFKELEKE